jgi:hypothetical protein
MMTDTRRRQPRRGRKNDERRASLLRRVTLDLRVLLVQALQSPSPDRNTSTFGALWLNYGRSQINMQRLTRIDLFEHKRTMLCQLV